MNVGINSTIEEIISVIGPRRAPLAEAISMTLVYAILLITGVIGNVCTCIVITRNKFMHTATNYYLFSLAISDLLLLIFGIPEETYNLWERYPYLFGEVFCILRGFTSETSTNASVLTITAFTVERYIAICHPLKAHTMSKLKRAIKLIIAIWCLSAVFAVPLVAQFGVVISVINGVPLEETAICTVKKPLDHAFEISTGVFFIFPMMIISVLYVLIAVELRKSSVQRRGTLVPSCKQKCWNHRILAMKIYTNVKKPPLEKSYTSRKAVVKMLVAVVVAFFICWAPFHAQRLMAIYVTEPTHTNEIIFMVLTYISGVTYYVSATINPILYSILSVKFRQAFKDTLIRCCGQQGARRDNSYTFRYRSTERSSTGCDATESSSNNDSTKKRGTKASQCAMSLEENRVELNGFLPNHTN